MFNWARAQNAIENTQTNTTQDAKEQAERARIAQERTQSTTDYEAAKVACYQQFAVNSCLTTARNKHNAQIADLKRQDISLSDVQRKRRGAEQLQRSEEKASIARQEKLSQQRGNALANDAKRQERVAQQAAGKQIAEQAAHSRSQASTRKQENARNKAAERKRKMAEAAHAKARSEQRNKEADEHRASVQNRLQNSKKKPAASLPVPAN